MAPCISQRVSAAGKTSWQVKVRTAGFPPVTKSFDTYAQAELGLAEIRIAQARGIRIDHWLAQKTTFSDVLTARVESLQTGRRKVKGAQFEIYRLKRFRRDEKALCAYAIANMTQVHFEDWKLERLEEVVPGTLKRELTLLRPILKKACRQLGLAGSPLDHVENPQVHDERIARFRPGEEDRLMIELQKCENRYIYPAAQFSLETSVRRGELLSLQWANYDPVRGTVFLPDSKNGRSRSIPLTRKAQAIVESLPKDTGRRAIFAVTMETLKQAFERARERAGMVHWRWHDVRHEAVSRLFDADWPAEQVMDVSGPGHRHRRSCYGRLRNPDRLHRPCQPWRKGQLCTKICPGPLDGADHTDAIREGG